MVLISPLWEEILNYYSLFLFDKQMKTIFSVLTTNGTIIGGAFPERKYFFEQYSIKNELVPDSKSNNFDLNCFVFQKNSNTSQFENQIIELCML